MANRIDEATMHKTFPESRDTGHTLVITKITPAMVRASRVQQIFGIHRSTLYRWVEAEAKLAEAEGRKPKLKLYKRGAATFVKPAELEDYITGEGEAA